jgi:two-component system, NarL family, sensor histidine kinase DevS
MDLHDNTMQSLYGSVLALGAADRLLEAGQVGDARDRVGRVIDQLNGTIHDLRAFVFELDLNGAAYSNLRGGLAELAEDASRLALLHVDLAVDEKAEAILGQEVVAQMLSVAREAISNVIRHASASELTLRVALEDRHVLLDVIDDGRGFDVPEVQSRGRRGLANISERVRRVGGELSLSSEEGLGTRMRIQLPVGERAD